MAEMMDDIAHLSQEIGPRPAGTEEEQQAALYIADELQKSAGFSTVVEDVSCASEGNTARLICFAAAFVCTLLVIVLPVLAIPCIIIGLIAVALFAGEALGKPVLSRFLRSGVSQNVVARYNPVSITNTNKHRKIILVTHYDSARVASEHQGVVGRYLHIIQRVSAITLVVAPLILLLKTVFFAGVPGGFALVLTVLQVICLIIMALPLVGIVKSRFSAYNEAANNDAAGVAVLLDVARTVGNGLVSAEDMEARAREVGVEVHGEEAAYEAGVVPEGVEVSYQTQEPKMTPEESLAAAKAAIAALTGKPVADKVPLSDISSRLVHHGEFYDNEEGAAAAAVRFEVEELNEQRMYEPPAYEPAPIAHASASAEERAVEERVERVETADQQSKAPESFVRDSLEALQSGSTGMRSSYQKQIPSWARAAQEKAHANKPDLANNKNVSRSRFADAPAAKMVDAANRREVAPSSPVSVSSERTTHRASEQSFMQEPPAFQEPESELAKRIAVLREEIDDAAAPLLKKQEEPVQQPIREERAEEIEPAHVPELGFEPAPASESNEPQPEPEPTPAPASVLEPQPVPVSVPTLEVEEASQEDPIIVAMIEPDRQTPSEMIEQDAIDHERGKKAIPRRRAASRRSVSHKNGIGGFLDRASSMVDSVSSKVTGRKRNAAQDFDAEEDLVQDDIVLIEDLNEDPVNQTVSMPQIDVNRFAGGSAPNIPVLDVELDEVEPVKQTPGKQVSVEQIPTIEEGPIAEAVGAQEEPVVEPVSPIMGMEAMTVAMPTVHEEPVASEEEGQPDRHVIVLPDVAVPVVGNVEDAKQRAPMASRLERTNPQGSLLSNMLPRVGAESTQETRSVTQNRVASRSIGLDLPDFNTSDFERVTVPSIVSTAGAAEGNDGFVQPVGTAGNTGAFAQVTTELSREDAADEAFVDDADDSVYEEGFTQTGAFAGPDYVEMPRSRVGRLFGRFGRKKKRNQEEQSIREWVDVDSSYEARAVGKERGSWESFRDDDAPAAEFVDVDYEDHQDDAQNGRGWNGGAFSLQSLRDRVTGAPHDQEADDGIDEFAEESSVPVREPLKRAVPQDVKLTEEINNEMRQLRDFRHPDIDTEVWFVALGAEEALNSGMKAFIEEHHEELRGATIVNLEALGAGKLSFINEEGQYRPHKVSSRLKRILKQASEKSGVSFATNKLLSRNTAAHVAAQNGLQAMTLAGMDGSQTAYYGSIDDRLDIIQPETLKRNSRFVLELLKSV